MAQTTVHISPQYRYEDPKGNVYSGRTAFILNHLDSAESVLYDTPRTVEEDEVYQALGKLLDRAPVLARFL